jgi:hypothetical protein
MKPFLFCMLAFACGCSPYVRVQLDLVEQARKGVQLASESQDAHVQVAQRLHAIQRDRVDDAFDADVRERTALDANWVIEHRRAYAATLDALAMQKLASAEADRVARDNLLATDQALQQLLWLQSLQLRVLNLEGVSP